MTEVYPPSSQSFPRQQCDSSSGDSSPCFGLVSSMPVLSDQKSQTACIANSSFLSDHHRCDGKFMALKETEENEFKIQTRKMAKIH
jgi:hypothetical protein